MKKALFLQQLDGGKIVVLEVAEVNTITLGSLRAIRPAPESYQYPSSDNVFGVICDYFKPLPPPELLVNPT